jgi:hypothetical protein
MRGGKLIALRISVCIIFAALGGVSIAYFMGIYPGQVVAALSRVEATQIWQLAKKHFQLCILHGDNWLSGRSICWCLWRLRDC